MASEYVVRLISSRDHPAMSKSKLLEKIKTSGTDRHDKQRRQLFDDFYAKHGVDFFGTTVNGNDLEATIEKLKREFSDKTLGDRGGRVVADIAIVYKAEKCEMIPRVYEDQVNSDCFRFKEGPKAALESVREI